MRIRLLRIFLVRFCAEQTVEMNEIASRQLEGSIIGLPELNDEYVIITFHSGPSTMFVWKWKTDRVWKVDIVCF